jgi:endogenous inhibitor of DNA gyrase (YacG/DUF329 family)
MRCPICKQETTYEGNPFRPFCSERCKLIDLDNWLEGRYRIPESTGEKQSAPVHTAEEEDVEDSHDG